MGPRFRGDDRYGIVPMKRIVCAMLIVGVLLAVPALAQFVPEPPELNRIPAPLPPPPEPPIINGPIEQGPPPGVAPQKRLNTFHDRTQRCSEQGANAGLRGRRLSSYTRRCVNAQ
jgi:hypothetical protein